MTQSLSNYLSQYHQLFNGGRCLGWELEELIVRAINDDTASQHHATWKEGGHDDKADIRVQTKKAVYLIQVKSGRIKNQHLIISGYRLGRFKGDLKLITDYLNNLPAEILAVPYSKKDGESGRQHVYQICYLNKAILQSLNPNQWSQKIGSRGGIQYTQNNSYGVQFSLHPTLSWQIWWSIPLNLKQVSISKEYTFN